MPSQPNPQPDPFQEEVTTRYSRLPRKDAHSMPCGQDTVPESQSRMREQAVSQVFTVSPVLPSVLPRRSVEFVPRHVMRHLVAEYAEFVGQAAKATVVEEIVSLHYGPERFPIALLPQLVERLVHRMDSPEAVAVFVDRLTDVHPVLARARTRI